MDGAYCYLDMKSKDGVMATPGHALRPGEREEKRRGERRASSFLRRHNAHEKGPLSLIFTIVAVKCCKREGTVKDFLLYLLYYYLLLQSE